MGKKKAALAGRAWNLLRLALVWARKGGIFKRSVMLDLLKSLRAAPRDSINYGSGEKEFSFDKTPLFHFKMHRPASMRFRHLPHIPCINPSFDFDDDDYNNIAYDHHRDSGNSFFRGSVDGEDCGDGSEIHDRGDGLDGGDEGIDSKAEEFIARFYEQMKLQRQASYLEYNEMLQRSIS